MKTVADYVLVRVQSELNDFLGVIKDENGNDVKLVLNPNWKPTHHVRICGEVVAVPEYLSGADNPLYEIYPGCPKPTQYRSHDSIEKMMLSVAEKHRSKKIIPYLCGRGLPNFQSHFGTSVEVEVGSKVYFHYNCLLTPENFMFQEADGNLVYRIHYSQLFCWIRKNEDEICMLNGYVLVTPYFEETEEIDVDGVKIRGKTKGSLVTEIGSKPKYLTGIVQHIGKGIGPDSRDLPPGSLVLFRPSSEFSNVIEDQEFFTMRHWDLVATFISEEEIKYTKELALRDNFIIEFNDIIPVGDYVAIAPEDQPLARKTVTHVYNPNLPTQQFKPGEIFLLDNAFSHEKKKKIQRYGVGEVIMMGELCKKKFDSQKVAYELSSYYLWVPEFGIAFIREGDILGTYKHSNDG